MKNLKSHFKFNKQERSGIFFLLLLIVFLQLIYFAFGFFFTGNKTDSFSINKKEQAQIDLLKDQAKQTDTLKLYPFNPNFITDYKGYTLGMSAAEIDRLLAFRAGGEFANSSEDFQKVTGISDSLLTIISPYFKFPEWTQKVIKKKKATVDPNSPKRYTPLQKEPERMLKDLNRATAQDLRKVSGIGEKLSARIVKFRDRLGGFMTEEQLYDVYGLDPEVVKRTILKFKVLEKPKIEKININTASAAELSKLIYIQKYIADRVVAYRNIHGGFNSLDELQNIEDFPSDKIERIALYLSL